MDGQSVFDKPIKNNLRTYDKVRKITIDQTDDYTTGCLLDYPCFKLNRELIAIDLNKQVALDAETKTINQINFTGNLNRPRQTTMLFII